ncbi:MAG: hypothetical protein HY712_01245 [candidate division NC10 bacterium]|nr:hypothetical protein [candidate division NC10 bacterium]
MSNEGRKRPYAKPSIERVNLVGEEMAGTPNCKSTFPPGGGGRNVTPPTPCTISGPGRCRDSTGS